MTYFGGLKKMGPSAGSFRCPDPEAHFSGRQPTRRLIRPVVCLVSASSTLFQTQRIVGSLSACFMWCDDRAVPMLPGDQESQDLERI